MRKEQDKSKESRTKQENHILASSACRHLILPLVCEKRHLRCGVSPDYIRLVNSYLPDVWNPEKFFVPDVLTRIPINYLCRIVMWSYLGFTITLERVLGV